MLYNHAGGFDKAFHALKCGVGISNVVKRQLFTLQLHSAGNAGFLWMSFGVKRGILVRVLTVAHVLRFNKLGIEGLREGGALLRAKGFCRLINSA